MATIGTAYVEVRALDKFFEKDVRKAVRGIKDVNITVKADVNMAPVYKKLRTLRASPLLKKPVMIKADVDDTSVNSKMKDFVKEYDNKEIQLNVNEAGLNPVREQMARLTKEISRTPAHVQANVNTAAAEVQLATLTRRRHVRMDVDFDPRTIAALKGFFYTLTGGIPMETVRNVVSGVAANFESLATKTGAISTAVTSLVAGVGSSVADLLVIGGDITKVVGTLNAVPAAMAAGGLAIAGTVMGWKGFGAALSGDAKKSAEAMKLLPPEAQKAVEALDGLGGQIRKTTQTSYWKAMGTSVQDVVKVLKKDLIDGFEDTGDALGSQMSAVFDVLESFGASGGFKSTFDNLNKSLKNSVGLMSGLTLGLTEMLEGGSRSMPAFGTWLSKVGTQFGEWAKKANEAGDFDVWIANGTRKMQELGKLTQATYGAFSGLTTAARNAGANGLTDFANGMIEISNAINTKEFQAGMTQFFRGAKTSMANASEGFSDFFETVGKGVPTISKAMEISGTTLGQLMSNVSRAFENGNLGDGFIELLSGIKDAAKTLEPGFENLGNALGGLGRVAGEVVRHTADGLNQLFETFDIVINGMADGMIDALPVFNDFVQGLLGTLKMVAGPLSNAVGGVLTGFSNLPAPIQTALMSMGAFLGATALLNKKFPTVAKNLKNTPGAMKAFADSTVSSVQRIRNSFSGKAFDASISNAFIGPLTQKQTRGFVETQKRAASQITTAWRDNARAQQTIWAENARKQQDITTRQIREQVTATRNQTSGIGGQMLPVTSGRNILGAFERIPSATKAIAKSASSNLGSLAKTAGAVGGSITKGIGGALGGVMGVLGGPWGIAIAGAVAGFSLLGQAAADEKAKVEAFKETLGSMGEITTATKDLAASTLSSSTGSWWDHFNAFMSNDHGQDVGKTLDTYGLKARDLVDGMVSGGEQATQSWQKVSDAFTGMYQYTSGEDLWQSGTISKQDLDNLGIAEEKFRSMSRLELSNLSGEMTNMSEGMRKAVEQAKHLQKTFKEIATDQVKSNADILTSQVTSLEEKMSAFKSNMQIGGLENLSGQQGFYQLGMIADQNSAKIKEMSVALGASGQSLRSTFDIIDVGGEKNVAMFKMSTASGRQMYDVMKSQADGIHAATLSTYDTVLKKSGSVEEATSKAMKTAKTETDAFVKVLEKGGLSKSAIETVLDTSGLSDKDIEIALTTKGIDQAIDEALRVQAAMEAAATGDYTMVINASSDKVKAELQETLNLGENFSNKEFQAKLSANFTNQAEYQSWLQEFNTATDEKKVQMIVDLRDPANAEKVLDDLLGKGNQINDKTFTATAKLITEETGVSVEDLVGKLNTLPPETIKKLKLDTEGDPAAQVEALLKNKEFRALLKTEVTGDPKAEVESKAAGATIDVEPKIMTGPLSDLANMFGHQTQSVEIKSTLAPPEIPTITVPPVTIDTKVDTSQVTSQLNGIGDKNVNVKVSASGADSVKGTLDGIKDKSVKVSVKSDGSAGKIKESINGIKDKSVTVSAKANSGPIQGMKDAIASVKDKNVQVKSKAPTGPIESFKKAIGAVKDKAVSVKANTNPGAVSSLQSSINSLKGKTVTVTVRTNRVEAVANGGIFGGVRTFARGGFDDPRIAKALERANRRSGSENHTAQIARGSNNYRVWAEAETGGEAYIPLAKAKRSRSMKILKQVMSMFGVQAQAFADGGLTGKNLGGGITTFADGGVSKTQREVDRLQKRYNKEDNKTKKKALKNELDASKKRLETAKKEAEILKNMKKDRSSILKNIGGDLTSTFKTAPSALQSDIKSLRSEASKFISTYKKTRPKDAKAMEKVSNGLKKQYTTSKGFGKSIDKLGLTKASARLADRVQKVQKTRTKKDDVLKGITLRDYERAIDATANALKKAETKLEDLKSKRERVVEGLASSISGEFKLNDMITPDSRSGLKTAPTAKNISAYAKRKLAQIKGFKGKVNSLLKKGYDPAIVEEIAQMGIEDGTQIADALLKDTSQKNSINKSYKDLQWHSEDLGKLVGNKMYKAGIDSAKGLVNGLKADEKALKEAAVYLGDLIYKEFKKTLGIKSPSRVMASLGKFIPQGVALGIESEKDVVSNSIRNLVNPKDLTIAPKNASQTPIGASPSTSGIMGGVQPQIIVNPSPGMNEVLVGQAASRELMYRLV